MAEGYVNLFLNEHEGTNRPHYKGYFKIDGVDHEFALWPVKEGKKGFSGKYKPKQAGPEQSNPEIDAAYAKVESAINQDDKQEIPF